MNGVKLELLKLALASHLSKDASEPVSEHDMTFVSEAAIELLNEREKFVDLRDEIHWVMEHATRTGHLPPSLTDYGLANIASRITAILDDAEVIEVWKA